MISLKTIPNDFNWKLYLEINTDLPRYYAEHDCINHYLNYGQFENRIYKKVDFSSIVCSSQDYMNQDLYYLLLNCIKYKFGEEFDFNNIRENTLKINEIVINQSNEYMKLNKKSYLFSELNKNEISTYDVEYSSDMNHNNEKNDQGDPRDDNNFDIFDEDDDGSDLHKINYSEINSLLNIFNSFILILDLSENYGGGLRTFINNIINKYSKKNNFLILRPNETNININSYNIYINDTIVCSNLDNSQIVNFITNNKSKIKKIFFNHIIDFSKNLLQFLISLPIEKTTITHDHYFFTQNLPHITIDGAYNLYSSFNNNNNNYFLNWVNIIITQNINNIYMINNKLHDRLVISELPDFQMYDKKIVTNNRSINLLFIGHFIQDIKGYELVKFLIHYYKDTNIKIFICGSLFNYSDKNISRYKNIYEFNELLINYKPNIIIETSTGPETYSYTLSLSMITQLPILSLKKPFHSVVEARLKNYDNWHTFSCIKQLNNLIHEKKQDFFYTVKPTLYFNNFWDNYFNYHYNEFEQIYNSNFLNSSIKKSIRKKNIVFITSKIHVSNVEFSYVNKRSIYTSEQRFKQTLNTIQTVKKYIPNCFIILIDNSVFKNMDRDILQNNVDYFINPYDNDFLNYYTDLCKYKCLGELAQHIFAYYFFFKHIDLNNCKYFFKISGRYHLNEYFNYENFNNDKIIFKQNQKIKDRTYFYTCFYKMTNQFLPTYFNQLIDVYLKKDKYFNKDMEVIFAEQFNQHISLIDVLGITQLFSCWNIIDKI